MIQDNDMIVATQGRAFWVMDDLNPIYELSAAKNSDFYVYKPEAAIRDLAVRTPSTTLGQNPYEGFSILYYLKNEVDSVNLTAEILDANGKTLRTFSTDKDAKQDKIKKKTGTNRLHWDLALTDFQPVEGVFSGIGVSPTRVIPGKYSVKMRYGDQTITKDLEVKADPRWSASQADYQAQSDVLMPIQEALVKTRTTADELRSLRAQVKDIQSRVSKEDYADWNTQADELIKSIDTVEAKLIQPNQKTFQDVINFPNQLDAELAHIYGTIANQEPPVTDGQKAYAEDILKKYEIIMKETSEVMKSSEALQKALIDQKIPFLAPKKK
jgi:hypothetical protein